MQATATRERTRANGSSARCDHRQRSLDASSRTSRENGSVGSKRSTSAMEGSVRSLSTGAPAETARYLDMVDLLELQCIEARDHFPGLHHALRGARIEDPAGEDLPQLVEVRVVVSPVVGQKARLLRRQLQIASQELRPMRGLLLAEPLDDE